VHSCAEVYARQKKREDGDDDGDGDDVGKVCGGPGTEMQVVDCGDGESSCSREIINYGKSKIKIIIVIVRR